MAKVQLVEGWTGPVKFQLLADGSPQDLTGATVELILIGADDVAIDTAADVVVTEPLLGKLQYNPDPTDLTAAKSLYRGRFKVTDSLGKVVFFPSGQPDSWEVVKQ
jgi:hypothetical protein